jgi:multidrug efflux system membrane fusion protein
MMIRTVMPFGGKMGTDAHSRFLWLGGMVLVALCACTGKKEQPRPRPPAPVTVAVATLKSVPVQIRAIGNVEAYNTVTIKSQINGQLNRVHFREGEDVRKGDLLFSIDSRTYEAALKQAQATLAKDQAQAKYLQEQARRYGALLKDGIVTQDQYDQVRANADAYEATIASDRAAVDSARVQLEYCSIRSPLDGRTGTVTVQAGNLVKANDNPVLVTINQVNPIYVTFALPEKELAEIKRQLSTGNLRVEAVIPQDSRGGAQGEISFLDNSVDTATGTIKLKGTFANRERRLWPGQFVNVVITLATRPNAVVVPMAAVQTGQQGQYLFVVKGDGTVEMRQVTTSAAGNNETVIEKGVQPGDRVVTDGHMRLTQGAMVEIKQGAGNGTRGSGTNAAPAGIGPGTK